MNAVLDACRDYYDRFSTPSTLDENHFADAIRGASDAASNLDPWGDVAVLAAMLEDCMWELPVEMPEDGWIWADGTRGDLEQAAALMLRSLEILKRVQEREGPRFLAWDERTTQQHAAARGNVVPIRR